MTMSYELAGASRGGHDGRPWRYSCELHARHIGATVLPYVQASHAAEHYEQWLAALRRSEDALGCLALWAQSAIRRMPGGIDVSHDVDGGGFTQVEVTPTLFTQWVALEDDTHVRFSEARTALHHTMATASGMAWGGALRTPVMGGVVLEATSDPLSADPRDAVSLAIYEFAKKEDARYPWLSAQPGCLFDLTQYTEVPFTAGPLYSGHPNQVTGPGAIDTAIAAGVYALRLIGESYTAGR